MNKNIKSLNWFKSWCGLEDMAWYLFAPIIISKLQVHTLIGKQSQDLFLNDKNVFTSLMGKDENKEEQEEHEKWEVFCSLYTTIV